MKPIILFTTTLSALNWVAIQMPAKIAVPPPAPVALNLFVAVLALLAGGCSHEQRHENHAAAVGPEALPAPPVFLTGPAVVLLTHSGGFTARLIMSSAPSSQMGLVSGQLVAR